MHEYCSTVDQETAALRLLRYHRDTKRNTMSIKSVIAHGLA